jgi:hypothetical protein
MYNRGCAGKETYIRKFEDAHRSEDLDIDGKIILKIYLKEGVWRGVYLIRLNRNRGGGVMVWTQERTFRSHNMSKFCFHMKE